MGTTLAEELEQAADDAVQTAEALIINDGSPAAVKLHHARAARLRARTERVREWERELARTDKLPLRPGVADVFRALTGPLPATPPETPGDPQEKGPTNA